MSQENEMVNKKIIEIDGDPQSDLTNFGELSFEGQVVEVPAFEQIIEVSSGVTKNPRLVISFKNQRNTKTRKLLKDWKFKKEHHDVTVIECDGDGLEYDRTMYTDCQCLIYKEVAYDAAAPTYAQNSVELVYSKRIPL